MTSPDPVPSAVVFDLDGTLVDSMPMVLRAFAHALAPFREPLTGEQLFLRLGAPPERTFRELLEDDAQVPEAMQRLADYSNTHWHLITPFEGVYPFFERLRTAGRELALWTGRDRSSSEVILREQRLAPALREIVCGDDLETHKPHPEGLVEIMRRLAVLPAQTLYVGDADVDVLAGSEIGVRTILIRHGRLVDPVIAGKAWRVVESPGDAYNLIGSLLAEVV